MTSNNSNSREKIFFIIIVTGIPILLNIICLTKTPFQIVGDGKLWLNFWGAYIGGVITVYSAYYLFIKERDSDRKRKAYEVENDKYNQWCIDIGKLCEAITVHSLPFHIGNMANQNVADAELVEIGKIEEKMVTEYRCFCYKYKFEKNAQRLFGFCSSVIGQISACVDELLDARTDLKKYVINEQMYNTKINSVCKKLEGLGDYPDEFNILASEWQVAYKEKVDNLEDEYMGK